MDLGEAFDRFARSLYRHALAVAGQQADAEDAVQAAFLKLAARDAGAAPVEDLEAYLHVAVRREALRIAGRRRRPAEVPGDLAAVRDGDSPVDAERVGRALAGLPPEQREVVVLHVWEEMTFERIGAVLGIPPDTASSRYRYARDRLKEKLKDLLRGD